MNGSRRPMNNSASLMARRTQASRDALRRRQKEKKARIVKNHVRYKQKQKLLAQLAHAEKEAPVVAPELGALDGERATAGLESYQTEIGRETVRQQSGVFEADKRQERLSGDVTRSTTEDETETPTLQNEKGMEQKSTQKHIPFSKERKHYEEVQKRREQEQKERENKIKQRETMLRKSKKRRKEQVCAGFFCLLDILYRWPNNASPGAVALSIRAYTRQELTLRYIYVRSPPFECCFDFNRPSNTAQ